MTRHDPVSLRLKTANGLVIGRDVPWAKREAMLKRLDKACAEINEHLDFEALTVEVVES